MTVIGGIAIAWGACAVGVVGRLLWETRRPLTPTDEALARIDHELQRKGQ